MDLFCVNTRRDNNFLTDVYIYLLSLLLHFIIYIIM